MLGHGHHAAALFVENDFMQVLVHLYFPWIKYFQTALV
jgi:hypothetical protein